MTEEKHAKAIKVLALMWEEEVSVKDLSIVIAESAIIPGGLSEVQKKIKGFLYENPNIVETE